MAKFTLKYVETRPSQSLPSLRYPVKYHLEASRGDLVLELDITSIMSVRLFGRTLVLGCSKALVMLQEDFHGLAIQWN